MVDKILEEGRKTGFSTTEVFRKKTEKTVFIRQGNIQSEQTINTDRLVIRAFRETGAPLGFTVSTADIYKLREYFHTMYSAYVPDNKKNFASHLPDKVGEIDINIYDNKFNEINDLYFNELKEKLFETQIASFKGLKIKDISFSKMLKKVYFTNTMMYEQHKLKVKYRKTAFNLKILFSLKNNLIEIVDSKPFFSQFNPDKIVSRAYNLLSSLTENNKFSGLVKHLLLSPEASSTILREFSTYFKSNSEKRLKSINFPQALSIIDNPLFDNQSNSVPFDDEGIQSTETYLIEKGFIRNRISNIQNSFENQSITTGNGFRSQKSIFPEIKFTNLYIKPSTFPFSKLLSDGERGILISLVKLMQVEGDKYVFSAYGYEFVDGNINKPIHLFLKTTIESFFLSILKVSKEIRFFYNILNVGAPYLLIESGTKIDNTFEL